MGAGIGFVRDAQNRARQNRDNLMNKSNFQKTYSNQVQNKELKLKEGTPEEIEQFRIEFLKKKRLRLIKRATLMTIAFAGVAFLMWQLFTS